MDGKKRGCPTAGSLCACYQAAEGPGMKQAVGANEASAGAVGDESFGASSGRHRAWCIPIVSVVSSAGALGYNRLLMPQAIEHVCNYVVVEAAPPQK